MDRAYWEFLLVPWKLITFLVAASGLILAARYTTDVTWDFADAALMAALTFTTAPWVIGVLYRAVVGGPWRLSAWLALLAWYVSVSGSYDLDLWARGRHAGWEMSLANLLASSVLYVCAGLFWNLDRRPEGGVVWAFTEPDWPQIPAVSFRQVAVPALLLMAVVAGMLAPLIRR